MKNIHYILIISFFYCFSIAAQTNLVPNPGFETINFCNSDSLGGGIWRGYAPPWDSPSNGTADLYNTCCTAYVGFPLDDRVPSNCFGFQYAHSGNGYAGSGFYGQSGGHDYREYLQVELDSSLIAQEIYCASFYVNFATYLKIASNNIGLYFSDTHINMPSFQGAFNFVPQINETNIVSDSVNWTLISGQYIAHGGERYIMIGNFYADSLTDTIHNTYGTIPGPVCSYYYIDDINVHCCSCGNIGIKEVGIGDGISVYPNPTNNKITIELNSTRAQSISILDVLGQIVKQYNIKISKTDIDLSDLQVGMYFVEVDTEKGILRRKVIKD